MKPTKIKAWPELTGFVACLPPFRAAGENARHAEVEVDFSSVRTITSAGLTVFLLQLLRLLANEQTVHIQSGCSPEVVKRLSHLNAFSLITDVAGPIQNELAITGDCGISHDVSREGDISLPVYRLLFGKRKDRRKPAHQFKLWLVQQLAPITYTHYLEPNGLVMLLWEIAKNTADHANQDALFGLDVIRLNNTESQLAFVFGDLGIGIKQHINHNLPNNYKKRREHIGIDEAYKLALTPGYTSNHSSGINKGFGMSIIIECATSLGIQLSIFDAWSRGLLDHFDKVEKPTHEAVRRIFHNIGHDVGFFYFGEVNLKRRSQ